MKRDSIYRGLESLGTRINGGASVFLSGLLFTSLLCLLALDVRASTSDYARLDMTFERAALSNRSITVRVHLRGEQPTSAWGECELGGMATNVPHEVIVTNLTITQGGLIQGSVESGFYSPFSYEIAVRATVSNALVSGRFEGRLQCGRSRIESNEWMRIEGRLIGRRHTERELQKAAPMDPAKEFPCHRGRFGNGTTQDCGQELVSSIAAARLLWASEEETAGSFYDPVFGGYATPVVASNRVYLYYGWPEGKVVMSEFVFDSNRMSRLSPAHQQLRQTFDGQDVVLCTDATTGRTIWKVAFDGLALLVVSRNGPHNTVVVDKGKVFAQMGSGRVRCLDAETGRMIWDFDDFPAARVWRAVRERILNAKTLSDIPIRPGTDMLSEKATFFNGCPMTADGVLVVSVGRLDNDKGSSVGVMGLDMETGKPLWGPLPDILLERSSFVRWTHKGREFIVSANSCIEPRTGRVLWRVPGVLYSSPAVSDDYLVTNEDDYKEGILCFRITPEKAERVWALDKTYRSEQFASPVIHKGYLYALARRIERGPKEPYDLCVEMATGTIVGKRTKTSMGLGSVASDNVVISGWSCQTFDAYPPRDFDKTQPEQALPTASYTSPALADGRLFVRLRSRLACYDLRKSDGFRR